MPMKDVDRGRDRPIINHYKLGKIVIPFTHCGLPACVCDDY